VLVDDLEQRLVEAPDPQRPKVHLPQPVGDLLERHVLLREHVAHVHPVDAPAHAAVAADAPHLPVRRVLGRGQPPRVRAAATARSSSPASPGQRLVRALGVVLAAEAVEHALLRPRVRRRGPGGLRLERAVHALVPPVLLRRAGLGQVWQDPQSQPPHAQRREPRERDGRERDAVVAADARGQAVLAEQPLEDGPRARRGRRRQPAAREQERE
jgi:hypothetical protein